VCGYNTCVTDPPPFRRLHRLFAPYAAFVAAFVREYQRPSRAVSAPAQALQALHDQNRALQAEVVRWQLLPPPADQLLAWQTAVTIVPDGVLLCHPAGRITTNPAAQRLLGLADTQDAPDLPPDVLRYPSGQSVPPGAWPWTQAAQTQTSTDWTPYLVVQDTHAPRPIEIAVRPTSGGAVAIVRDMSAQIRAAAWETQARHTQGTLAEAARRLGRALEIETLCQITTDMALLLLPPRVRPDARALLCTFDGRNSPLLLRALSPDAGKKKPRRHADTLPPQFEFDAQSPLLWKVYLDRQLVVSADIGTDPLFAQPRERALLCSPRDTPPPAASVLMLPLLPGAAASGHLLLTSPLVDAFGADTQDALLLLSTVSASALARAHADALRREHADQFAALQQAALAACALSDTDAFADTLTHCAAAALGASLCTLSLTDAPPAPSPKAGGMSLRLWGTPPPDTALSVPIPGFPLARCACTRTTHQAVRRGVPAWQIGIPNPPLGECQWRVFGGQSGTHSALALPLRRDDTTLGALTVFRQGSAPFSPHEMGLTETFSALASLALERSDFPARPA